MNKANELSILCTPVHETVHLVFTGKQPELEQMFIDSAWKRNTE